MPRELDLRLARVAQSLARTRFEGGLFGYELARGERLREVHDLEGAAELYTRAGFSVGPQTDFVDFLIQRDIQVPGFYLSLMSPPVPPTGIPVSTDPVVAPRFAAS